MKVIQYIKVNHYMNRVAFASGVILALLAIALHLPIISNGEQEAQAATGTAQESSLTLAVAQDAASLNLNVTNSSGTFATSSAGDEASFNVVTNNYTGYTLSISASDNNGTLINGEDSLASISSSLTASQFNVSANNGKWGYKPNKYRSGNTAIDNTGNDAVFLASPTTEATTLDITNAPNANANTYSIALGARADYTKPNGNYSKTFIITAVANRINYSVTYNKNTEDTVTNMPYSSTSNTQSGDTNSTTIALSDLVPARGHYSFLGWCSVATTTSNGIDSCSGTTYNPNGAGTNLTYGIDKTTLNNATLYAMWKIDTFTCAKQYRLQNADGTYPSTYTSDGSETINYDSTCTYGKTVTDYQGNTGNNTARSTSQTITANTTLSLDFPRNTYALTVNRNTSYISSVSGAGTYRWGQAVAISATASDGNEFTAWSQTSGTAGTFASTTSASTTFTMPKSVATIYADGKSSKLYLQNMTAEQCTTTAQTVYDSRDEEPYLVQKLADNKCWLLDNLRLDLSNSTVLANTTADNTNASATALNYLKNGGGESGSGYAINPVRNFIGNTLRQNTSPYVATQNKDKTMNLNTTVTSYGLGSGKIGVYYNSCAASSGTVCYHAKVPPAGGISEDICPSSWHIPSKDQFQSLITATTGSTSSSLSGDDANIFRTALSTPLSGLVKTYHYGTDAAEQNSKGYFFTTMENSDWSHLQVDSSSVTITQDLISKRELVDGYSVRCLLK